MNSNSHKSVSWVRGAPGRGLHRLRPKNVIVCLCDALSRQEWFQQHCCRKTGNIDIGATSLSKFILPRPCHFSPIAHMELYHLCAQCPRVVQHIHTSPRRENKITSSRVTKLARVKLPHLIFTADFTASLNRGLMDHHMRQRYHSWQFLHLQQKNSKPVCGTVWVHPEDGCIPLTVQSGYKAAVENKVGKANVIT